MNQNRQVSDNIFKAIQVITDKKIAGLQVDKTLQGRITAVLGNDRYHVAIQGAEYTSVPCAIAMTFLLNESVWVTLPQGDFSNMFIAGRRAT